ncbi:MAG: arsenite methyltransferase [Gammaproteobacteria bacterium]|nr:arsenite methyltransferase [Gammaproteobacteria bacterium]
MKKTLKRNEGHASIRKSVAKDYTRAIKKKTSCCCNKRPVPKGVVVKLAGYSEKELAALPEEAITNSFGCGNPTAFTELKPGDTVLDLGSGAGIDLLLAAKKVGPTGKVIGIDMTNAMIAKAKKNIAAAKLRNAEVRKGLIEDLPVENNSVDWVISNCVINLSPEKPKVFREIFRVLKPGGHMLVSDIVAEWLPKEIIAHPALYSSCLSGAISEKNYISGLKKAGMKNVKIRDRLVYDFSQLQAFICSELQSDIKDAKKRAKLKDWAKHLLEKVWSIRVSAVKPKRVKK